MAKAKSEAPKETEASTAVAEQAAVPAVVEEGIDFGADAGAGTEGATAESYAIPFLTVIQSNSPQVIEGEAKYMSDAKPGMLLNTVTGQLIDGKVGALLVPAAYRRTYLQWGPRQGEGGGFKGEHSADEIAEMKAKRQIVEFEGKLFAPLEDGGVNPKRCRRFSDTRLHYCMLVDETGKDGSPVLLSITSTQIKKSKQLLSALSAVRVVLKDGRKVMPPTFANLVRVVTVPESNDEGNWFGVRFAIEGKVESKPLYEAARTFHDSVLSGTAAPVNYEQASGEAAPAAEGRGF